MMSEGKCSALVVDDNAMNLKMIGRLLGKLDMEVTTADSGAACLELVKSSHYDMIFMDHMMPDMDGVETFRRLKEMTDSPSLGVPVIALTANTESGARELYMNEGFADFITKPVMPADMEKALDKYLPKKISENDNGDNTEEKSDTDVNTESGSENSSENSTKTCSEIASKTNMEGDKETGSETTDPDIDGLDWNFAKLHFTDHETMMEMLHDFYVMISGEMYKLQGFYDKIKALSDEGATEPGGAISEALSEYRIQVHAMKASASLVGIIPLAGCAKILENSAAAENYKAILAVHDTFAECWKSYKQKLSEICDRKDTGAVFDKAGFLQHLDKLAQASEMLDLDTMDPEMASLSGYSIPSEEAADKVDLLQGAVAALDTDMISDLTSQLKQLLERL